MPVGAVQGKVVVEVQGSETVQTCTWRKTTYVPLGYETHISTRLYVSQTWTAWTEIAKTPGLDIVTSLLTVYAIKNDDNDKVLTFDNVSPITLNLGLNLSPGFNCKIVQMGTGVITLVPPTGVILNNRLGQFNTAGQYSTISLIEVDYNVYVVNGDTA